MKNILVLKEHIRNFYGKYEIYLTPIFKFLLALLSLLLINGAWGYMEKLKSFPVVLVVALMCSFLPMNCIILFAAGFMLLHLYALSVEAAVVVFAVFLLMFLLYFRFAPKDTLVVLFLPMCFLMKIPYIIPIAMGLLGSPVAVVSVSCGVMVYYILAYIAENQATLGVTDVENGMQKFKVVIDGLLNNKAMLVTVAAFAVTVILVYTIRRMSINHSWTVAIIAGALANVVILLFGDLIFNTNISIAGAVIGSVISVGIAKLLQFFVFNVDYSRTELVQFEDDEYYYYVKAVPKITLATPEKSVKRINTQRKASAKSGGRTRY
ncbi:MAG: hypothetical protein GX234_06760 [Clostridiales bacterium]|nr:hypothetical protein [Clostridiales bacterium]